MRGRFNNFNKFVGSALVLLAILFGSVAAGLAQELQSGDFNDSNPILTIQGGFSSSTNFQVYSGSGQAVIGESTSSAFIARLGWFYFPSVAATSVSQAITVVAAAAGGGPGPLLATTPTLPTFASLNLTGETVPNSQVTILRDGALFSELKSDFAGKFFGNFTDLAPGQSIFTIFSTDQSGQRSAPTSLLLNLVAGQTINTGLLILAPSISAGEAEIKRGELADISGQTAPLAEVTILVEPGKFLNKTKTGADGRYNFKLDTKIFKKGQITIRTRVEKNGQASEWSRPLNIIIGDKTTRAVPAEQKLLPADYDRNYKVDIVDFSILLYWFNRQNVPEEIDLNADDVINLVDFSIFIYYWTG